MECCEGDIVEFEGDWNVKVMVWNVKVTVWNVKGTEWNVVKVTEWN